MAISLVKAEDLAEIYQIENEYKSESLDFKYLQRSF